MSLSTLAKGVPNLIAKRVDVDKPQNLGYFTSSESSSGLDKWQLALLVGSPIVIGAAVYYFYYRQVPEKSRKGDSRNGKSSPPKKSAEIKQPSDPYERAMSYKSDGNNFFRRGAYAEALEAYSKAIECCPPEKTETISIFHQNKAAAYEMLKEYEKAVEECTNAIKLNNKYVKALQRRAKAYESLGDIKAALNDITVVDILEKFQNKQNVLMTDRLLKQLSQIKASEYFKNREFKMPSRHFIKSFFASYRRDPLVILPSEVDGQDLTNILTSLEEQQSEDNRVESKVLLMKGTIALIQGNSKEALEHFEKISSLEDVEKDVMVNTLIKIGNIKAQHSIGTERIKDTLEYFTKAIEVDESNQDIYIHRAQIYLLDERVDEAFADMEKCCEYDPDFPSAVAQKLYVKYRMAIKFNDISGVKEAIETFQNETKRFPNSSEVYSLYAQALMEQSEFDEAEKLFKKALKCDPGDANSYVYLGILAMQSRMDLFKAKEFMEQALKVDEKCPFAYEMLGTIEVQLGNFNEAISCFEKALELSSSETDCAHLFSLRDAAEAQYNAAKVLNVNVKSN